MERRAFRAMGTDVELLLDVPPGVETFLTLAAAEQEMSRLEAILSRFREDSELSALNRTGRLRAGPELVEVTQLAVDARLHTKGRFDPTVHDALVAAGYDRSFEQLQGRVAVTTAPPRCGGRIAVDPRTGLIELEPGFRLDLGGIAKGYAVDRLCDTLSACGPCLVDAGGDIAVRGGSWPVGVETADDMLTLELSRGALATSGIDRRRWSSDAGSAHHVIDPATGRPADRDLVRVTVFADSAAEAEVAAKSLYLAGAMQAAREADELGTPAVLVTKDGQTVLAGGLS
jgi:thiamine biosynthesis lipoprotein